MQNTLLGLGIALILALVTALAGPLFVDWGRYRAGFEQEASRMTGLPVRIGGAIDVRLLPTPTIVVHDIEVGPRAAPVFGAQSARAELALGSLMRGEWRAAVLTLKAPDISLGLDRDGRVVSRNVMPGVDLDRISIDQIVVTDATLALEDASSLARVTLENLSFDGEMRSLAGALRGEGMFAARGEHYKFRVSSGRNGDALRVHVNLDAQDRPLSLETDGRLAFEGGAPSYEGSLVVLRPAGVQLENGRTVASDPWRLTGKIKADARGGSVDQLELNYGPDERVVRMTGAAEMKFGAQPGVSGELSARQADLDRALTQSDATNRLPLAALRGLTESFAGLGSPPVPVRLGLSVDTVTLSGSTLQSVHGDLRFADGAWRIDSFEFRAPGFTQVALSGRFSASPEGTEFSGPLSVDSADPRSLLAWLEGFERVRAALAPLKLRGDITAGRKRLMIEHMRAEADRRAYEGRLAYVFPSDGRPAKLDAALTASEFDFDGAIAFFNAALTGASFARPGEIGLAIDLGRSRFAGVSATSVKAGIHIDGDGVRIDRLSVGDFGGAALNASGQIDISAIPPRGEIKLSIDAQKLDGLAALAAKFSPAASDVLARYASTLAPANLESSIKVEPPAAGGPAVGRVAVEGRLGAMSLSMNGNIAGTVEKWNDGKVNLTARIGSNAGAVLAALGLDRLVGTSGADTLVVAFDGPLGKTLAMKAKLTGEGLAAVAEGGIDLTRSASGMLRVSATIADLRGLRRDAAPLPVTMQSGVRIDGGAIAFENLAGKIGTADLSGRIVRHADGQIEGNIETARIDAPAVVAAAVGLPPAQKSAAWSSQPFLSGPLAGLSGKVAITARQAALAPSLTAEGFHCVLNFAPSEIRFEDAKGNIGKGAIAGGLRFGLGSGGVTLTGTAKLTDADAGVFIPTPDSSPARGAFSAQVEVEGTGSTPASLVGALRGTGTITLEKAQLPLLDGGAIDVAVRAVERGTPINATRIADIVTRAMDGGTYSISRIVAPFEIAAGRARLGTVAAQPRGSELAISGSVDLVDETLDARLTLTKSASEATGNQRPGISVVLKGPYAAPKRSVDVSSLVGWLTLQAVDREAKKLAEAEREAKRRERIRAELEERLGRVTPAGAEAPSASETASPGTTSPALRPSGMPAIESAPLPPIAR